MTFTIFKDKDGDYRWNLKAGNGKIVADSAEGYKNKADCEHGISLVKSAATAPVKEDND